MAQKYFIKATLEGMTASYDKSKYQMGENVHPSPDLSNVVCGEGFHLARTVTHALGYVPNAKEFYLATPGKILGSDETKVRTDRCTLLVQIPQDYIDDYKKVEASAWEAHEKAIAPAWEAYKKAIAPARQAYKKVVVPAREAHEKVEASARQAYEKAIAPAWEAYEKAIDPARQAYKKAIDSACRNLISKAIKLLQKKGG